MANVRVTIRNWDEFNYRKDVKNPSWFKLHHSMLEDHELFDFTHSEIVAWIYILSLASKKSSASVLLNFEHAERLVRLEKSVLESALKKLESIQCVHVDVTDTLRERDEHVTQTGAREEKRREEERREDKTQNANVNLSEIKTDKPFDREQVASAVQEWALTLERHGIKKDPWLDADTIGRLIIGYKSVERVALACFGAGFEESGKGYDASKNVSIRRLLKPENFSKFENLGAQEKSKIEARNRKAEEECRRNTPPDEQNRLETNEYDPDKARAYLAELKARIGA